jgi:hypothetical protein
MKTPMARGFCCELAAGNDRLPITGETLEEYATGEEINGMFRDCGKEGSMEILNISQCNTVEYLEQISI